MRFPAQNSQKVSGPSDRPGQPLRAIQAVPPEGIPSMTSNPIGQGWMSLTRGSSALLPMLVKNLSNRDCLVNKNPELLQPERVFGVE